MSSNRSIKKLEIKNFQSHSNTIINFDEGINIVQGTSNAGKSAINRAIVWALGNKPRGDYFIKKGALFASVKITFYDNSQLLRVRGIDDNFVIIKHPSGKSEKYEKFGGGEYPDEVKKFLSIPRENESLGLIFYAEQMSPLFLIDLPPADLPRAIGYLAGSDIMESAAQSMMSESRSVKRDGDLVLKEIKKTEKELKEFSDLNKKFNILNIIQKEANTVKEKESKLSLLTDLYTKTKEIKKNIKKINDNIYTLDDKIELNNEILIIKEKISKLTVIKKYSISIKDRQLSIQNINQRLEKSSLFFKNYKQHNLKNLKNTISNYNEIAKIKKESDKLIENIKNINQRMNKIDIEDHRIKEELKIMRQHLLDANYICKECGQKLK